MTLYDIHTPTDRYGAEVDRLSLVNKAAMELTTPGTPVEKERFRAHVVDLCNQLMEEQKVQSIARAKVTRRLGIEKPFWFPRKFPFPHF